MSGKRQKKRKPNSEMFDLDRITAEVKSKNEYIDNIRQHMTALRDVNLEHMLAEKANLTEEEAISLAGIKFGVKGLLIVKEVLRHVPGNLTRMDAANGTSMRFSYMSKLLKALVPTDSLSSNEEEFKLLCTFLEAYCPDFLKSEFSTTKNKNVWDLTRDEGIYFNKFFTPPVSNCLDCDKQLTMHNNPSKASLFTPDGPIPCSKISLECRDCSIRYGVVNFSNDLGTHFYPQEFAIDIIEISNVTYIDVKLYRWIPSLSNHCWVSFSGFSEAYNDVNAKEIEQFRTVTHGFPALGENEAGESGNENSGVLPGELSSKAVAKSFWHKEVEKELHELGLREKWTFRNEKTDELSGTYDHAMEYVDVNRCDNLYSHNCSAACKSKGCGNLFVADGNWKLRYAHCMWKVPMKLPQFGEINYPKICPLSPKRGHAFCESHCTQAALQGYPTELKPFLKRCGVDKDAIEQVLEDMSAHPCLRDTAVEKINKCLEECENHTPSGENAFNASTFQGTTNFLLENPEFVLNDSQEDEILCNKDTGGLKSLQCWSRGMFFIVSAGGHIEYWQPLYRSESPTQAYIVFILWLYRKFVCLLDDGKSEEEIKEAISSTCVSYDNMCHVDGLKVAKKDLPFPSPLNKAWKLVPKVIDRLHLRNHVDPKCKRLYNADEKIPKQFNTMACEQTFVWASRFKKIICAMPQTHQFFFLHRLVKYRNSYTEKCHKSRKIPVLPKVGKKSAGP